MKRVDIRKGDVVNWAGTAKRSQIHGTVVRRGRVNFTIELRVRFSPTGDWHHQTHRLPIREATHVQRGEQVFALSEDDQ